MNRFDGPTLVEYAGTDRVGHDVAVSAEQYQHANGALISDVWLGVYNVVLDECGVEDRNLYLTPSQARDLAASLLLAADHADGDWDER